LRSQGLSPSLINELIHRDAIQANGTFIEVQHEALADYLRAKHLAASAEPELTKRLETVALQNGSLFPTLLMSQLPSRHLQSVFWKRMAETELEMYLDALRYRFDLSDSLEQADQEALSRNYLEDILAGIEIPLAGFFPEVRATVIRYLSYQDNAELAVTGIVSGPPLDEVAFGFRDGTNQERIIVGRPELGSDIHQRQGIYLGRSGYRLDSGRLLGAGQLRQSLLKLIENQELMGGTNWISERLIGRIWHLNRVHQIEVVESDTFSAIESILEPHRDRWVQYGDDQNGWFSVNGMLSDIRLLRDSGLSQLDLWWRTLGWIPDSPSQTPEVLKSVIAEYYRRRQIVLKEIAERSFPAIASQMAAYTSLPERWNITLSPDIRFFPGFRIDARWLPAATWDLAGADVEVSDTAPRWHGDEGLHDALVKLGRPADRYGIGWSGILPTFEGSWWDGRSSNTTAIVREVCSELKKEIEYLFSALPTNETSGTNRR